MPVIKGKTPIVLAVIVLSLLSAFFVYFPLTNTDIWWHLAAAREMLARKSILYSDPFSYTLNNPKWINLHWIFQLMAFGIYSFAGAAGLVLMKCLAVAGICIIVSHIIPDKRYMIFTSVFFTLLIYEARYLVLIRPIIITLTCIAFYVWSLERFVHTHKKCYLWYLLPVQIIWTNSQGLFPLGPVIVGCYFLGDIMERIVHSVRIYSLKKMNVNNLFSVELTAIFALVISSCLLNPYGWEGFLFPLKLLGRIDPSLTNIYARNISENVPLFDLAGKEIHYVYAVITATIIVLFSFRLNFRTFRWAHILLFGIFLYLAFLAKRNVVLYFTVIPAVAGYNFFKGNEGGNSRRLRCLQSPELRIAIGRVTLASISILMLCFFFSHAHTVSKYPKNSTISPFRTPCAAVQYLKTHPIEGRMFNSIRYGGYLMWHFYPEKKVFIDGRLIIRSPQYFADYLSVLDNPALFPSVADRWEITLAILPTAIFYRYMPLVKWLFNSSQWDLVFADEGSVLFVNSMIDKYKKMDFKNYDDVERVKKHINEKWKDDRNIREEANNYFHHLISFLR